MIGKKVQDYCCEDISLVENYQAAVADTENFWDCHHRLEIQGPFVNSPELLDRCGMYTNVPASQLIFLTRADHNKLHHAGKKLAAETRAKISAACIGKKFSTETRAKLSKSIKETLSHPEVRAKMSAAKSAKNFGSHWWTNGIENKFCKECPGPEWKRGRLKH